MDFQSEKAVVRAAFSTFETAPPADLTDAAAQHYAPEVHLRAVHPWGELTGIESISAALWQPLRASFSQMTRREDIFFAGLNEIDGFDGVWVCSMGHLMGLFDAPFLGIPPTRRMTFLRYASFHRVSGGRIVEEAFFTDIPHLMVQAGLQPFPPQTGAQLVQPGPATHDGLLFDPQPRAEGTETLRAINAMIADLGTWNLGLPLEEELRRTWHEDMIWWGPTGIGATYTIPRYAEQHSGPFRAGFADRSGTGHLARLAEGHYGGFFGWPNFTARPTGGFMGMPATGQTGEFRVVDIYRRRGDKLAENWIFIDLLHFWKTQGVDILARTTAV